MSKSVKDYCKDISTRYHAAREDYETRLDILESLRAQRKAAQADMKLSPMGRQEKLGELDKEIQRRAAELHAISDGARDDFGKIRMECQQAFAGYYAFDFERVHPAVLSIIESNVITPEELLQLGEGRYKHNLPMKRIIAAECEKRAGKLGAAAGSREAQELSNALHMFAKSVSESKTAHLDAVDGVIEWSVNALQPAPMLSAAYAKNYAGNVDSIIQAAPDISFERAADGVVTYRCADGVVLKDTAAAYILR